MQKELSEVLTDRQGNYILPFYWLHGESSTIIEEGLEHIWECGIRAVCIEARPHPDYVGPLWWKDMDCIMKKANALGMRVWVLDDSHFPTGRCNEKITSTSPYRKYVLTHYSIDIIGPMKHASFIVDLKPNEQFVAAVAAVKDKQRDYYLGNPIDITHLVHSGMLEWDVPDGLFTVTIIKVTDQHSARPNYANLIDRNATRFLIDTVYEPHYFHYKQWFGSTFAGFFSDEPEIGNTFKDISDPNKSYAGVPDIPLPWCDELEKKLKALWKHNYHINLSALWNNIDPDPTASNKTGNLRNQYTELVTTLYQRNFNEQIGEWCHAHGVEYIGHIIENARFGVGAGHYFKALWGQDMAGIDVVLQSIRPGFDSFSYYRWSSGKNRLCDSTFDHYVLAKLATSLAEIDQKKQGRALCEIFGAYGWAEGVKLMKWLTDHMLVRGINRYVPHAFTAKSFPDPDCPPHFWAQGKNPQFPYFKLLMEYLNRICHLINGGIHDATVAILYSVDLESLDPDAMSTSLPAKELTQHQIDFDIIPMDAALSHSVRDGTLSIGQATFQTLVIPACSCVSQEFANWCVNAKRAGLQIVYVNKLPSILASDGTLSAWTGDCPEVLLLKDLCAGIHATHPCGITISSFQPWLRYLHYIHSDGEYYLFFNESVSTSISCPVQFEFKGPAGVAVYNAWENRLESAKWEKKSKILSLELAPGESKIIYCGSYDSKQLYTLPDSDHAEKLDLPWSIYLKRNDEDEFHCYGQISQLCNITDHTMFPNFCGTIKYCSDFILPHTVLPVILDLGEVYETAKVTLNKIEIGCLIAPPYRFDISHAVKVGTNQLEIEVTNTLVHQIHDQFSVFLPIEPSGLLGPIKLVYAKEKKN